MVAPASAMAAQSLAVTSPTGFPAGGHPTYSTKISLDSAAGTPSTVTIKLAPGVLAAPSANPSCVKRTQHTASCQIGGGSVTLLGLAPLPVTAYLAPPPNRADVVGIDVVPNVLGSPVTHAGGKLVQTASGNVQTVLNLSLSSLGPLAGLVTGMTLTVNGTLDGKPFNRMPTNCSPGHTTLTVAYAKRTESVNASPDFKPTGCAKLPYAPKAAGTARASSTVAGQVVTAVTQKVGEAASARTVLTLPSSVVAANPNAISRLNTSIPVGSAQVNSPLLPLPLKGNIYLTGQAPNIKLLFKFPPPAALTLTGLVDLAKNSVTIPVVPDVPLTRLQVTFPGGPEGLLYAACPTKPARLIGTFTSQSGKTVSSAGPLTVTGCPG